MRGPQANQLVSERRVAGHEWIVPARIARDHLHCSRPAPRPAVKQLMPGQDLTRVTIPAFFLEARSLLERMADTQMHPDLLLNVSTLPDPVDRIKAVTKWCVRVWRGQDRRGTRRLHAAAPTLPPAPLAAAGSCQGGTTAPSA